MDDAVSPFCSAAQFTQGPFGDLVSGIDTDYLQDALVEGTRIIEDICRRRMAPFTGLQETLRVAALDPDELAQSGPGSILGGVLPSSYSNIPPVTWSQIRHVWLHNHPPRYQDLWTWIAPTIVTLGPVSETISTILAGPDEAGHLWFQPTDSIPTGSRVRVTYGGGYSTSPASLVRANRFFTAGLIVRELNPDDVQHDPDALYASGERVLINGHWVSGLGPTEKQA